jgi:hypothetical protein
MIGLVNHFGRRMRAGFTFGILLIITSSMYAAAEPKLPEGSESISWYFIRRERRRSVARHRPTPRPANRATCPTWSASAER